MTFEEFRAFIDEAIAVTTPIIMRHYGDPALDVETKADATPVTLADRGAEEALRKLINERFPDHGIIGEEFGAENTGAEFLWVLDPVDGTKAFATACPLFGTLIALQRRETPIYGAIHHPALGQLIVGDGATTLLNGRPVRTRPTSRIEEATFLTTSWTSPARYQSAAGFDALSQKVRLARTWGDCFGYTQVAAGWADIAADPIVNPWDLAALIPIIRGAGGVITDWQGRDPVGADSAVACATPQLHEAVITTLNDAGCPPAR
ncbi:MAG: histidinol-phosphatase [Verrucomicrobia bacterium]|nr:MAG: histidinol-phosphatase [Verrucomicrobiota bacterium]